MTSTSRRAVSLSTLKLTRRLTRTRRHAARVSPLSREESEEPTAGTPNHREMPVVEGRDRRVAEALCDRDSTGVDEAEA